MSTSQDSPEPASSSAAEPAAATDQVSISIKAPSDSKLALEISLSKTVWDLKKLISEKTNPKVEADTQRLIYSGRVLKDESLLSEYKIQSGHTIHMQIPSNLNAGQQIAGNPLAPLLNATNQIPGFNPFADLGINTNDPNMAMNMMNNPQVLQSAARLLEDPAVVDQMIASDPRLQSMGPQVREMMRSPMFRQMLTNPDLMRSMHGAMRAPGGNPFGDLNLPGGPTDPIAAALGAQPGAAPGGTPPAAGGGLPATDPLAFMDSPLGQMMQQMNSSAGMLGGGLGFPTPQPADPRPPEERFEVQLGQLQAMGFTDARQNVRALLASGGSVEAAIEYILSGN
ncbi:hypothetical protein PCASD_13195 [Puccinia coronata f. sp. avenae]|uniref:Ubiquilin n=1 Tax=Puccinia coronata f. sp. avenae TaxID=200324 RepID=A0A2N5T2J4_9BASI|nr:hypothetical protein PCASD_13195 [Puccinia coronata f. sp. avenae]